MRTLKDAIYGLAVGDALGVPAEFKPRGSFDIRSMIGYGTHNQRAGTWSDDSSMTLATCASIKDNGKIDCYDIMNRFSQWYYKGEYTVDGNVFDIGNTTHEAIVRYGKDTNISTCGLSSQRSNGNGALMRILPLAFVNITDQGIDDVSKLTHAHEISAEACRVYVDVAKQLIKGAEIHDIIKSLKMHHPLERIEKLDSLSEWDIFSTGYVVHTLEAALWSLLKTNSYKDCVLKAVNLGDDTDTTGAVAGGLAGIVYGFDNIPQEWVEVLRNKELIEKCLF